MSNRYLVLVLTEPTEGNEARFNEYYEHTHLDEVIESTGWKSAQRFKLASEVGEACPLPYLAAYEAEGESAQAVIDRLDDCLLYTSPSPRDRTRSRMPSSA